MCPTINLPSHRPRKQGRSSKKYAKFYNTPAWKKLRAIKKRNNPLCERCLEKNPPVITQMDEVHHKIPFDPDNPDYDLIYNYDNLISLCYQCHREIQAGIQWSAKKPPPPKGMYYPPERKERGQ